VGCGIVKTRRRLVLMWCLFVGNIVLYEDNDNVVVCRCVYSLEIVTFRSRLLSGWVGSTENWINRKPDPETSCRSSILCILWGYGSLGCWCRARVREAQLGLRCLQDINMRLWGAEAKKSNMKRYRQRGAGRQVSCNEVGEVWTCCGVIL